MRRKGMIAESLFVAFLWGAQPVVQKALLTQMSFKTVMAVGSVAYTACMAGFIAFYWKDIQRDRPKLTVRNVAAIFATTICCAFVANLVYLLALKRHKSAVVSALIYSAPVFTVVLAAVFLRERLNWVEGAGVALLTAGVACMAIARTLDASEAFGMRVE